MKDLLLSPAKTHTLELPQGGLSPSWGWTTAQLLPLPGPTPLASLPHLWSPTVLVTYPSRSHTEIDRQPGSHIWKQESEGNNPQQFAIFKVRIRFSINTKELKASSPTDVCTPIFIAAAFTTASKQKQSMCASTDEWINKMKYINTTGYYSSLKRKEILTHATTWMNLENYVK